MDAQNIARDDIQRDLACQLAPLPFVLQQIHAWLARVSSPQAIRSASAPLGQQRDSRRDQEQQLPAEAIASAIPARAA
jgi:hypothetical protein